jgi:cyclohexanone monooxygenase
MNITGRDGISLNDHWSNGPRTFGGVAVHGFPNLFMVAGPQSPFSNLPPGAEAIGSWIAELIGTMRERGIKTMETTEDAEQAWVDLCEEIAAGSFTLQAAPGANSWFAGTNIEGKPKAFNIFFGGANDYLNRLDAEAASGYHSFEPDKVPAEV